MQEKRERDSEASFHLFGYSFQIERHSSLEICLSLSVSIAPKTKTIDISSQALVSVEKTDHRVLRVSECSFLRQDGQ